MRSYFLLHVRSIWVSSMPLLAGLALFLASCAPVEVAKQSAIVSQIQPELPAEDILPAQDILKEEQDNQTIEQAQTTASGSVTTDSMIAEIDKAIKAQDDERQKQIEDAERVNEQAKDDVIASIIWELEQTDNQSQTKPTTARLEDLIPIGRDPSLEEAALDAAFAMLQSPKEAVPEMTFTMPAKTEGRKRIGVFVPRTGARAIYGNQVADGIEMALFQINNPILDIIYFDTNPDKLPAAIAQSALQAEIDIAIGPLFSDRAKAIGPYFMPHDIPVLSLSNNHEIARNGLWVLGFLPEQQIDGVLAESILKDYDEIAILSDQSAYGAVITKHVTKRLKDFGLSPSSVFRVDGTVGADDAQLVEQLKAFARYKPLEDDELVDDIAPPYDSVIIAGGADFVLKVAPLLSYYDLGPDRVNFLGTDLWANAGLLGEPSLQGAYIATIRPDLRDVFGVRYDGLYQARGTSSEGSFLSQLGFDAFAVAASAVSPSSLPLDNATSGLQSAVVSHLVKEQGFKGYTGAFRLLANGLNQRDFSLYQVENGQLQPASMTPKAPEAYNSDEAVLQN